MLCFEVTMLFVQKVTISLYMIPIKSVVFLEFQKQVLYIAKLWARSWKIGTAIKCNTWKLS